jgi:hypothetical protein
VPENRSSAAHRVAPYAVQGGGAPFGRSPDLAGFEAAVGQRHSFKAIRTSSLRIRPRAKLWVRVRCNPTRACCAVNKFFEPCSLLRSAGGEIYRPIYVNPNSVIVNLGPIRFLFIKKTH